MDPMHRVDGVVILNNDGGRVFAQYYTPKFEGNLEKQKAFETILFEKTRPKGGGDPATPEGGDIALIDSQCVVYRQDTEVYYYVIGALSENEVVLSEVLTCLCDALLDLIPSSSYQGIELRTLLHNFDLVCLVVDEILDDGVVLQTDRTQLPVNISRP